MEMKAIIFTEGGKRSGLGHISRCVSLYDELYKRGINTELVIQSDDEVTEIVGERHYRLANWCSINSLKGLLKSNSYCIIDSYMASDEIYKFISRHSKSVVFMDDTNRIQYPKGIVVHPSLFSKNLPSHYLAGPEYVILRNAFQISPPSNIQSEVKEVLITLGGTLQPSLIQTIVCLICSKFKKIKFHVLLGNSNNLFLENDIALPSNVVSYTYLTSDKMKRLMIRSDLVITAAGQTIYELLVTKTPFLPVQIAENQERNMSALFEKELVLSKLIWGSPEFEEKLLQNFVKMLDVEVRKKHIEKSSGMLDGKGAERIIDALLCFQKSTLSLRPALIEDSPYVFELSNEDYVRRYSINQDPILWENHKKWYESVLLSPRYLFLIVTNPTNQVLGQIRYELTGTTAVISISLSQSLKGKRMSQSLIEQSIKILQRDCCTIRTIVAQISKENIASIKTFEKVGFKIHHSESENTSLFTYKYIIK